MKRCRRAMQSWKTQGFLALLLWSFQCHPRGTLGNPWYISRYTINTVYIPLIYHYRCHLFYIPFIMVYTIIWLVATGSMEWIEWLSHIGNVIRPQLTNEESMIFQRRSTTNQYIYSIYIYIIYLIYIYTIYHFSSHLLLFGGTSTINQPGFSKFRRFQTPSANHTWWS